MTMVMGGGRCGSGAYCGVNYSTPADRMTIITTATHEEQNGSQDVNREGDSTPTESNALDDTISGTLMTTWKVLGSVEMD